MQIIKSTVTLLAFFTPLFLFSQTTYIPEGSKAYDFIDRMEIKQQTNPVLNFSSLKPYSRRQIVESMENIDSLKRLGETSLTPVDEYNLHSLLMNNSEWVTGSKESFSSEKPIWNTFYKTKANFFEVDTKDFFLAVNPVINFQVGSESGNNSTLFLNKRGITARGRIANKIGFSTTISENQERGPEFFQDRVRKFRAVPGVGFYKNFKKNAFDYFDARGYVTFSATKYIDIQFGYDKNFIGDGYRSLFLSDDANSYLFLKLNTRIWKFNYQNLFMELTPQYVKSGDRLLPRKYAAMHHLSMNVTNWLNVGVFESVVFGRSQYFDFQYLNPIIFLRYVEGNVGSPDKAHVGLDFKANVAHQFQFYGQFLLDEFILKEITKDNGFWANKYAYQLGAKYVDAFTIKNLDLQIESNRIRPFTYSHYDSVTNYTHYNQMLAHPLGANLQEFIGVLKYQPVTKWYINARAIYYYQGLDSAGQNFGANPFKLYTTREGNYGYFVGDGNKAKCLNAAFTLSYELKQNLFIDGGLLYRKYSVANGVGSGNTSVFNIGVRWNAARREYNY
jgi:hypothetical protein